MTARFPLVILGEAAHITYCLEVGREETWDDLAPPLRAAWAQRVGTCWAMPHDVDEPIEMRAARAHAKHAGPTRTNQLPWADLHHNTRAIWVAVTETVDAALQAVGGCDG